MMNVRIWNDRQTEVEINPTHSPGRALGFRKEAKSYDLV